MQLTYPYLCKCKFNLPNCYWLLPVFSTIDVVVYLSGLTARQTVLLTRVCILVIRVELNVDSVYLYQEMNVESICHSMHRSWLFRMWMQKQPCNVLLILFVVLLIKIKQHCINVQFITIITEWVLKLMQILF